MAETPLAGNGWNWISDFNRDARTGAAAAAAKDQSVRSVFCQAVGCLRIRVFGDCIRALHGELFFRGFLYPVLARRLGVSTGVVLTALPFALIHEPEYKAWGPGLIIFLVGVVLTL